MRIVDRKTFLTLPAGTFFVKFPAQPIENRGGVQIKGATVGDDFVAQDCLPWFEGCEDSTQWATIYAGMTKGEASPPVDYDVPELDGLLDQDQLFMVWDIDDSERLVGRFQKALFDRNPSGDYIYVNSKVTLSDQLDPTPPQALASFYANGSAPRLGNASFVLSTGNDPGLGSVKLYRVEAGAAFDPDTATLVGAKAVRPSSTYTLKVGDTSRKNMLAKEPTLGTGWTISDGIANHAAGSASNLAWPGLPIAPGKTYRYSFFVDSISGDGAAHRVALSGGGGVISGSLTGAGQKLGTLIAKSNTGFVIEGNSTTTSRIYNAVLYEQTAACVPQGIWDYYAVPVNASGVAGPPLGPVTVLIH
ncbi:hypothetical protein [Ensifer sp. OTU672]|uniref:hypothetical protein n=1 Tax=Ensifer sp. OTU672 TaxID=3043861 RepID=UPI00313E661B